MKKLLVLIVFQLSLLPLLSQSTINEAYRAYRDCNRDIAALTKLYLLSDNQLIEAFISIDPLSKRRSAD